MAGLTFSYEVIENGPRNFIFVANGVDATTTVAFTAEATVTGIIAAAGYTPTTHLKVRRLLWSLGNCAIRLQWHQTANVDLLFLSGFLNWDMKNTQGIVNPNGTGSTGDIDLIAIPTAAVTAGAGIVTATASIYFECIKGVGT
jgi:hypothetical protein